MEKIRVCHFTSVHNQLDDRIYLKECCSLAEAEYEVYLVARGDSQEINNIHIIGCGEPKNRIDRLLFFSRRVYKAARRLNCAIYHFHDPELLPYGLKLNRKGKKVIFDSHEDVPAQILDKNWIPMFCRKVISFLYTKYETIVVKKIYAVITATDYIKERFYNRAKNVICIRNAPKLDDIYRGKKKYSERNDIVCYVGGISGDRGEEIMREAIKGTNARLIIAGDHEKKEEVVKGAEIEYTGKLDRKQVNDLYSEAKIGLVLLKPLKNYVNSLPIKMFEYMAAGLPVICSNFETWKEIIESINCGICVETDDIDKISEVIKKLLNDKSLAEKMGENGYNYVQEIFNWKIESVKLIQLYGAMCE